MTTIKTWARGGAVGVEISGHAGYARAGADIVCAGVSGMCYLLAEAARALGAAGLALDVEVRAGDGVYSVALSPAAAGAVATRCLMDGVRAAGERLAAQYPDHVRVVG